MPEPDSPRRPPFGYGKALPGAGKGPPSPPKPPPPRPAFEVVEDAEAEFEAVDDPGFEVVEEPARPAAKVRPSDPTPLPQPKLKPLKARATDEDEEEDRPRPKKPKRKKKRSEAVVDEDQQSRDRALAEFEWIWPAIILTAGMIMTFVGAFGAAGSAGAFHTIGVLVIGLFVSIPLTIGALMIVGILIGIEYGRFGPAVLKIAAITFVVNGIYFLGAWAKLPLFVLAPVACVISFALFMSQFDLDTWETNVSAVALNVLTFAAKVILIGFLVVAASSARKDRDSGPDTDDDAPADTRPNPKPRWNGGQPPPTQPQPGGDDRDD